MTSEIDADEFRGRLAEIVGSEEPFAWAKRIGIPSSTFDRIWNQRKIPKAETLFLISRASGRSIDWLLTGEVSAAPRREGGGKSKMDEGLLDIVSTALFAAYRTENIDFSPAEFVRLVMKIYLEVVAFEDVDQRRGFVAGAIAMYLHPDAERVEERGRASDRWVAAPPHLFGLQEDDGGGRR